MAVCRLAFRASTWRTKKWTFRLEADESLSLSRGRPTYPDLWAAQQDQKEDERIKTADDREAHDDPERNEHDHPAPGDEAVQAQRDEDELNDVDCTEELELEVSIVLHRPEADRDREQRDEDQRNEGQHPDMASGLKLRKKNRSG